MSLYFSPLWVYGPCFKPQNFVILAKAQQHSLLSIIQVTCDQNWKEIERKSIEFEQKLNGNWGQTMKAQFWVPGSYMQLYPNREPRTDLSWSILKFCSISVQILFNYQLNWNWTGRNKTDDLTHCVTIWSRCHKTITVLSTKV